MMENQEQMEAQFEAIAQEYNNKMEQFWSQHDFNRKPSRMAKSVNAWTRENLLLDAWNQFLSCEEAQVEFLGIQPEGNGWRELGEVPRYRVLEMFAHYLMGYSESISNLVKDSETKPE